jgi:ubiquinone/menaquinone biosynthesis C-methylase UbiE
VKDGFVDAVENIDVEDIPYPDDSIDLVIAKETFHHWPRPFIGLYEMIRVSKKYVAIIEPYDCLPSSPSPYVKEGEYHDSYEEIGNYKYQLSLRELLKASWAMGLPGVAAKGFNDPYQPGQSIEEWLKKKEYLDQRGKAGERQYNLMAIFIAKTKDSFDAISKSHSKTYEQPPNPHKK